jgi:hypothetical protein
MSDEQVEQELKELSRARESVTNLDWPKAAGAYASAYGLAASDRASLELQLVKAETTAKDEQALADQALDALGRMQDRAELAEAQRDVALRRREAMRESWIEALTRAERAETALERLRAEGQVSVNDVRRSLGMSALHPETDRELWGVRVMINGSEVVFPPEEITFIYRPTQQTDDPCEICGGNCERPWEHYR